MSHRGLVYRLTRKAAEIGKARFDYDELAAISQRIFDINPRLFLRTAWKYSRVLDVKQKRDSFRIKNGMSSPRGLIINPTDYCQLQCDGCFTSSERENLNTLEYEAMHYTIGQAREMGTFVITFMGGDPLHPSSVDNVYSAIQDIPDMLYFIITNGIGFQDRFIESGLQNPNHLFFFSCNGLKEVSEQSRGIGSFDSIESVTKDMCRNKIPYGISTTVRHDNWEHLSSKDFVQYFSNLGAVSIQYFPYAPTDGRYVDKMLNKSERKMFKSRLEDLRQDTDVVLMEYTDALNLNGCKAGRDRMFLGTNGDVSPCFMRGLNIGNIHDQPLEHIVTSDFVKEFRTMHRHSPTSCLAYTSTQQILDLAHKHDIIHAGNLEILKKVKQEPLFTSDYEY